MCKNYKTNLIEEELNKLNLIENESIRKSCMSILSYLIKKNTEENKKYLDTNLENLKDQSTFKISLRKFLGKYNRSHQKISLGTLKNRIDLLIKYKLINLESKSTYSFFRYRLNKDLNKNLNNENIAESIVNTGVNVIDAEHKYLNNKININNNINNSVEHVTQTKIFVTNIEEIKEQLEHYISKFNIKYDFAIKEVKRRVKKIIYRGSLRFKGVENYLISILNSVKNYFIPNCFSNKNKSKIINNTASVEEDIITATKIDKTNYNIKNNFKKIDFFNNYPQRHYDFDSLEKKLLGWE
ncbi:hypothetical protein [Clostridium botulinum]|uniref:hypothetical protein n=1 Tax=Clostridium botulinum TaxID=1491 RepID=UPI0004D370BF|nr:hypothetical protein [Clostridium botulinum]KEH96131.1 putative plasmid replication protein [Clostridium botulinum D str. 16868]